MIKASLHPMYHSICVNMSDKNVHTCPWLCVVSTQTWVFRLSQDYVARLRVRMGSKITHGEGYKGSGARNGLWPGVTFLGDLINCYTGELSSPSKPTQTSTCKRRMQHSPEEPAGQAETAAFPCHVPKCQTFCRCHFYSEFCILRID